MSERNPAAEARRCPVCGKPADAGHRPFCSARCRTIDLGRWLKDAYRVPTNEGPDEGAPVEDAEEQ